MRLTARDAAFDAPADEDDDNSFHAPVFYPEDKSADPAELAENDDWEGDSNARLAEAVKNLDERGRDIIYRRWLRSRRQPFMNWLTNMASLLSASASWKRMR